MKAIKPDYSIFKGLKHPLIFDLQSDTSVDSGDCKTTGKSTSTSTDGSATTTESKDGSFAYSRPDLHEKMTIGGGARAAKLYLPHGVVHTPVFMPVGTQGTMKGMTSRDLEAVGSRIILGNTYHLGLRPGPEVVQENGGLHQFMQWAGMVEPRGHKRGRNQDESEQSERKTTTTAQRRHGNMLTDSGGFQMVSLVALTKITEEGVLFRSPVDGSTTMLTPEESIRLQNCIGADIIMQLDDVVHSCTPSFERFREATERSVRWLDRCIVAHARTGQQNLFGIVQGGLDSKLRAWCLREMMKRDCPGWAIGGLAGGEDKNHFWRVVLQCCRGLPAHKPRYLMGVGYPLDLVVCVALGVDMFDCVWPTRTARFGTAIVTSLPGGLLHVRKPKWQGDMRPLDPECDCRTCVRHSRAYVHMLVASKQEMGCHLLSAHNLRAQMRLMTRLRRAVMQGKKVFDAFVGQYLKAFTGGDPKKVPQWAQDALEAVDVRWRAQFE